MSSLALEEHLGTTIYPIPVVVKGRLGHIAELDTMLLNDHYIGAIAAICFDDHYVRFVLFSDPEPTL